MNKIRLRETIQFEAYGSCLNGEITIPFDAKGLVIFSHGSGSSRFSPRNNHVARLLNDKNFATLLTDLLTEDEDRIFKNRFDIGLLTERLVKITIDISNHEYIDELNIGYFGASTGAASAINAAARLGSESIRAIVSRGGRPDLSMNLLDKIKTPVLLIAGGIDPDVFELNRKAFIRLNCEKQMEIVPGASHLFEEPGKLDEVASLACKWFEKYLPVGYLVEWMS